MDGHHARARPAAPDMMVCAEPRLRDRRVPAGIHGEFGRSCARTARRSSTLHCSSGSARSVSQVIGVRISSATASLTISTRDSLILFAPRRPPTAFPHPRATWPARDPIWRTGTGEWVRARGPTSRRSVRSTGQRRLVALGDLMLRRPSWRWVRYSSRVCDDQGPARRPRQGPVP
ncbi:hypothetical protein SAFG77S_08510 [Streptomyces afghaniensis]